MPRELSRRSLLSAAVAGVSLFFTGCLGMGEISGDNANNESIESGQKTLSSTENKNGLEYHKSEIMEAREGVFDSDFYYIELESGEWTSMSIETPNNPDMAIFLDAWEGNCTVAFITKESFEENYPNDSLNGRVISHDSDNNSPAYTIGETTDYNEWVIVVNNTGEIGPFDGSEPVDGYLAIGERVK